MKALSAQPNLVEQVRDAILEEIASGQLPPGERIIQEQIAQALGVSRQPVQQALLLLRNQGMLRDAPGRGLIVAPLDPEHVQHMYDIRAVLEGLACRRAAGQQSPQAARQGAALIETGRKAVASGSVARMIAADMRFHEFLYGLSGNPLIAPSLDSHLTYTQRVMGEVLMRDQTPRNIWDQHAAILEAICAGDADRAEALARTHITQAAGFMVARLQAAQQAQGEQAGQPQG
ncbi:GntR family transcriptional regulator [Ramlibacter sp. 2FC]|uniref:GntR family transcriptional regulator n=1 Tax=Ramlibacter sp. 2FC TaxID=2502188 RepID=UPI0010F8A859|nr:GntR family transcriptional regulator [Ramlibacter sp. 2FC]